MIKGKRNFEKLPVRNIADDKAVINAISLKDVDGFSHNNKGKLATGDYGFFLHSCWYNIYAQTRGNTNSRKALCRYRQKQYCRETRSSLMLDENATVTICHSKTPNLKYHTLQADIIISAVGHAKLVTADMVKRVQLSLMSE